MSDVLQAWAGAIVGAITGVAVILYIAVRLIIGIHGRGK
jgi:hypothetical protein